MREHTELVYILQNRLEKGIVYFFWQIIFRAILLLTLRCLDNIYIFFDSRKFRISVFYMREHIELVYILQKKVENGIVYFLWETIFRAILLLTLGCLDNIIRFFSIRIIIEFLYITWGSILRWCIYSKTE